MRKFCTPEQAFASVRDNETVVYHRGRWVCVHTITFNGEEK